MTSLVSHPWDKYGQPRVQLEKEEVVDSEELLLELAELEDLVHDKENEIEDLEDEVREAEDRMYAIHQILNPRPVSTTGLL